MTALSTLNAPPAAAKPYVIRAGDGRSVVVAGQVVRILAGVAETSGGYGAVVLESAFDARPIPMHYHVREHDTWLCTRGRLQVWANDAARVLTEGDFAYVQPGDVHSYQCVAPRTEFFGVVAPGGWEGFFDDAGQPWISPALPPGGHPFDFSRMGPAMGKHGVMRVERDYVSPSNGDGSDRVLPTAPASYFLQAGYGPRHLLNGHLATTLLDRTISKAALDMVTIEAGRGAAMPQLSHTQTHVTLYVLNGSLELTLSGSTMRLDAGDFANIPVGCTYRTEVLSGRARWVYSGAGGDGLSYWSLAGTARDDFQFTDLRDTGACTALLAKHDQIDLVVAVQ